MTLLYLNIASKLALRSIFVTLSWKPMFKDNKKGVKPSFVNPYF